jgi:O-antigen ligase
MTESIRILIVIMVLSGFSFWILAKPYSTIFSSTTFSHLRNSWLILVAIAFISPNFWFFIAISFVFLIAYLPKSPDEHVVYYLLLLCALPDMMATIPGFGGIQAIFNLSYNRLLIILLLVPVFLNNRQRNPYNFKLFSVKSDIFIILFIAIQAILQFRYNTVTNALRDSSMLVVDIFIPYYIISRHVNSQEQFNRILAALLITISILALIGLFEASKFWILYSKLRSNLVGSHGSGYDVRAGNLRATTVFMSPIVFGYVLIIGFGLLLYLRPLLKWKYLFYLNATIIILALLATVSRGPWLGFVVLILAYIWTGRGKIKKLSQGILILIITIPFLALTPFWDKFIQLLPFVGTVRSDTISYREQLFEMAWIVFQRNPLFGSTTYLQTDEMESMRQGHGIIDVVNTYIQIALSSGLVGLTLFTLIFTGLIFRVYMLLKLIPSENEDLVRLGRVLIAILVAIMFTITTVSSIDYIPIFYWTLAGLTAGYIFIARKAINNKGTLSE